MRVEMKSRIVTPISAVVTLLFSLVLAPSASAEEPGLLYGTAAGGTQLVAFNLQAGTVRVIGEIGYPSSLALTFCRPGGTPYTIINPFSQSQAQLATLNLGTGEATPVGSPLGQNLAIMGLTCSPDGTLYAVGQNNVFLDNFNSLYTVDRETGLASLIGPTEVEGGYADGFLMALDFAPDGTLYGANARALFRIDQFTGHAEELFDFDGVTTVAGVTHVMGLAIGKDSDFFVADYWPASTVYALEATTGAATPIIVNTGLARVHGIAFKFPGR